MQQFGVNAMPTIKFMKVEGAVVHEFLGYKPLGAFIAEMDTARQKAGN